MMMKGFKIAGFIGLVFALSAYATTGVSVACMIAYEEGGCPAVLESPECPQWVPSTLSANRTQNCQFSTLQGRREYQEDRVTCNLQFNVSLIVEDGVKEVEVGVAAIFDGHGGKEASELAAENLLDYFAVHVAFAAYQQQLHCKPGTLLVFQENKEDNAVLCDSPHDCSSREVPVAGGDVIHNVLKVALLRTIRDIEIKFSEEAISNGYSSGSTGTVILLVNGHILVAHIGDTKALMCSKGDVADLEIADNYTRGLVAEELTRDHHPDREDEKARIEAAGGFVQTWGVPRVNGILAVSRAIGDLNLKRYGVSPVPEVLGWRKLASDSSFLVVASDGVFENMSPQEVCDLIQLQATKMMKTSTSLADHIVKEAYKLGSSDNLSVIVIPLQPSSV